MILLRAYAYRAQPKLIGNVSCAVKPGDGQAPEECQPQSPEVDPNAVQGRGPLGPRQVQRGRHAKSDCGRTTEAKNGLDRPLTTAFAWTDQLSEQIAQTVKTL